MNKVTASSNIIFKVIGKSQPFWKKYGKKAIMSALAALPVIMDIDKGGTVKLMPTLTFLMKIK